jgi:hypothetical protein
MSYYLFDVFLLPSLLLLPLLFRLTRFVVMTTLLKYFFYILLSLDIDSIVIDNATFCID